MRGAADYCEFLQHSAEFSANFWTDSARGCSRNVQSEKSLFSAHVRKMERDRYPWQIAITGEIRGESEYH
jgi:hypothetical protein